MTVPKRLSTHTLNLPRYIRYLRHRLHRNAKTSQ